MARCKWLVAGMMLASMMYMGGCSSLEDNFDNNTPIVTNRSTAGAASVIAPGVVCANGGIEIKTGIDTNGNGVLDTSEVINTEAVCNGTNGTNGVDGTDGAPGTNGTDGAPGTNGTNGFSALMVLTDALPADCANGGVKVEVGIDDNPVNNVLDAAEIDQTKFVCNGADAPTATVESCSLCHDTGKFLDASAAHAVTGNAAVTGVTFTVSGLDLVLSYNLKMDGVNATGFTTVNRDYRFDGTDRLDLGTVVTATDLGSGNYTVILPGAAANGNSRYLLRVANAAGIRALVSGDYPASPVTPLVSSQACVNCHSTTGQGFHYSYPLDGNVCVVCHNAANTTYPRLPMLIHGIHNSEQMPSGKFILVADDPLTPAVNEEESFAVSYPSYMLNCSVCHDTAAGATAAVDTAVSFNLCMGCHENWTSFGDGTGIFGAFNHNNYTAATVCSNCHDGGLSTKQVVADFHNGLLTGRSGLIYDGVDVSVIEGAKVDMQITGVTRNVNDLVVTWTASYSGNPVDPCNTTVAVDAPIFHAGGAANTTTGQAASNLSFLRAYGEGDDWTNNNIGTKPGQPLSTNLSTTNTSCTGNVATTTMPLTATEIATTAVKGVLALQGKAQVKLSYTFDSPLTVAVEAKDVIQVRSKTPTREFVVADGTVPATLRRQIVDTASCLKCHVGSLYQHGGNRIDNVDMCVLCHNEASNEQDVRVADGIDASEAYDGQAGQTYGFKSLLHAVHSSGETGKITMIYRTNGVYVWTAEGVVPPNWPGTGAQVVYGSNNVTRTHNLYAPTYPRLLNDCAACHKAGTAGLPDQSKAVATTTIAGAEPWGNGNDDTLEGPAAAACMSCHQSGAKFEQTVLKTHAYQNGWVPTTFPAGRTTILNAAK